MKLAVFHRKLDFYCDEAKVIWTNMMILLNYKDIVDIVTVQ